jgi:hypothetical protein
LDTVLKLCYGNYLLYGTHIEGAPRFFGVLFPREINRMLR